MKALLVWLIRPIVRASARILRRTPLWEPVERAGLVERWKSLLPPIEAGEVVRIFAGLEAAGVKAWAAGGWGVDALARRVTRPHRDLDLVLSHSDEKTAFATLTALGYDRRATVAEHVPGAVLPNRAGLEDRVGRLLDVHLIDLGEPPWSDPGAFAEGSIGGRPIPCLSRRVQLDAHDGYELRPEHREDIELLEGLERAS